MSWKLNSDRPIYAQLMERIETRIVAGAYQAGEKLPSVRDLAADAGVNPNTMQKALAELEQRGLLCSQRTNGRYVTEDQNMIEQTKTELAKEQILIFVDGMKRLGYTGDELIAILQNVIKEEKQ